MKKNRFLAVLSALTITAVSSVPVLSSAIADFPTQQGTLEDMVNSLDPEKNLVFPFDDGTNQKNFIVLKDDNSCCCYHEDKQMLITVKDNTSLDKDEIFKKLQEELNSIYQIGGRLEKIDDNIYFINIWSPCESENIVNVLKEYDNVLSIDYGMAVAKNDLCSFDGIFIKSNLTDKEIEDRYPSLKSNNTDSGYFVYEGIDRFDIIKSLQEDSDIDSAEPDFTIATSVNNSYEGTGAFTENIYTAKVKRLPLPKAFGINWTQEIAFDSDYYEELLQMCDKVDYSGIDYLKDYEMLQSRNYPHLFYSYKLADNQFSFRLVPNADVSVLDSTINAVLEQFDSSYKLEYSLDNDMYMTYTVVCDSKINPDTLEDARRICFELKEKNLIKDFIYYGDYTDEAIVWTSYYPTSYHYDNEEQLNEMKAVLEEYISENNLDCTVVSTDKTIQVPVEVQLDKTEILMADRYVDSSGLLPVEFTDTRICVVPNYEISDYEHSVLAQKIYNDLGDNYTPDVVADQSCGASALYTTEINLFNTLCGDANSDGKIDSADVVTVTAYVGNSEKNPLNEQQIINGDVHNTGDGLTSNDALMIQNYLSGNISVF